MRSNWPASLSLVPATRLAVLGLALGPAVRWLARRCQQQHWEACDYCDVEGHIARDCPEVEPW